MPHQVRRRHFDCIFGNRRKFPVSEPRVTGLQIDDRRLMRTPGPVGIGWQARLARHAAGGLSRCVARRAVMARARDEMKALLAVALTILLLSAPARAQGVAGGPDASGSKGMSGGKHRNGAGTKTQE